MSDYIDLYYTSPLHPDVLPIRLWLMAVRGEYGSRLRQNLLNDLPLLLSMTPTDKLSLKEAGDVLNSACRLSQNSVMPDMLQMSLLQFSRKADVKITEDWLVKSNLDAIAAYLAGLAGVSLLVSPHALEKNHRVDFLNRLDSNLTRIGKFDSRLLSKSINKVTECMGAVLSNPGERSVDIKVKQKAVFILVKLHALYLCEPVYSTVDMAKVESLQLMTLGDIADSINKGIQDPDQHLAAGQVNLLVEIFAEKIFGNKNTVLPSHEEVAVFVDKSYKLLRQYVELVKAQEIKVPVIFELISLGFSSEERIKQVLNEKFTKMDHEDFAVFSLADCLSAHGFDNSFFESTLLVVNKPHMLKLIEETLILHQHECKRVLENQDAKSLDPIFAKSIGAVLDLLKENPMQLPVINSDVSDVNTAKKSDMGRPVVDITQAQAGDVIKLPGLQLNLHSYKKQYEKPKKDGPNKGKQPLL